eukprot:comp24343_c0_seq1/m.46391 comp24343_c0_seq1/g.46391  ORF comp24343_c0_seq1/g.46391 comp24343_c0_seq1/m.46391 type:complete len:408 (-) comp24343_c0_seq1:328-1551(-)
MLTRRLVRVAVSGTIPATFVGEPVRFAAVTSNQSTCMGYVTFNPFLSVGTRSLHALAQGRGPQQTVFGIQNGQTALGRLSPFGMVATGRSRGWQTLFGPVRPFATRNVKDKGQHYRGVYWSGKAGKWYAMIGSRMHVGYYDNSRTAARQRDLAIDLLVQKGVLAHRCLDSKNVSLGNLRKFKPTADDLDWAEEWWAKKTTKKKSSVYKGETYKICKNIEKPWRALYSKDGVSQYGGSYATEVEAALARDDVIRALDIPKREKLLRLNFFLRSDYMSRAEAEQEGCIGVTFCTCAYRVSKPYQVYRLDRTVLGNSQQKYVGIFASITEGGRAYDREVLAVWAKQNEPRGPLPPTNFCPTDYGYELPLPPTILNHTIATKNEGPDGVTHTAANEHSQPHHALCDPKNWR